MTDLQAEHLGPVEIKHVGSATVTVLPRRLRHVRWDRRIHVGSAGSSHAGLSAHEAGIHQSPVWWCRVTRPGHHPRPGARRTNRKPNHHRRFAARAGSPPGARGAGPAPRRGSHEVTSIFVGDRARGAVSPRRVAGSRYGALGNFFRRSKRRLSGGRPGRADRMELGSGCNRQYGTDPTTVPHPVPGIIAI